MASAEGGWVKSGLVYIWGGMYIFKGHRTLFLHVYDNIRRTICISVSHSKFCGRRTCLHAPPRNLRPWLCMKWICQNYRNATTARGGCSTLCGKQHTRGCSTVFSEGDLSPLPLKSKCRRNELIEVNFSSVLTCRKVS